MHTLGLAIPAAPALGQAIARPALYRCRPSRALAVNFATKAWLKFGFAATPRCTCKEFKDNPTLEIPPLYFLRQIYDADGAKEHARGALSRSAQLSGQRLDLVYSCVLQKRSSQHAILIWTSGWATSGFLATKRRWRNASKAWRRT
jgi:hypothetical protein